MSFEEDARRGNLSGVVQKAALYGILWAIGSSWSSAIRAIALTIVPQNTTDIVLAELGAAAFTTFVGAGVAIAATQNWCEPCRRPAEIQPTTGLSSRSQTLAPTHCQSHRHLNSRERI